jgi:hypothetical protein
VRIWRIVYQTKTGGYRVGTKKFSRYEDALKVFAKNRDSKHPTVKHVAEDRSLLRPDTKALLAEFRKLLWMPPKQAWTAGRKLAKGNIRSLAQPEFQRSTVWKKYTRLVAPTRKELRGPGQ